MFMNTGNEMDDFCITDDLCIGTTKVPDVMVFSERLSRFTVDVPGPPVLTIVQIRRRKPYDSCIHIETTDDLPPLPPPPRPPLTRTATTETETAPQQTQTTLDDFIDDVNEVNQAIQADDLDPNYQLQDEVVPVSEEGIFAFPRNLTGTELRVVARLWGWVPQTTTLTGLDTVSVSPNGQRIAVAQWDRVLIYALDPAVLCEPPFDQDIARDGSASEVGTNWGSDSSSDDGNDSDIGPNVIVLPPSGASTYAVNTHTVNNNSDGGHDPILGNSNISTNATDENAGGDTLDSSHPPPPDSDNLAFEPSTTQGPDQEQPMSPAVPEPPPSTFPVLHSVTAGGPKSVVSSSGSSSSSASSAGLLKFYPRTFNGFLGLKVVELRPVVLKMEGGAVIRKMLWTLGRGSGESSGDSEGDEEDEEQGQSPDGDVVEYEDQGLEKASPDERQHGGEKGEVSAIDGQTEAEGIQVGQQNQDIQKTMQPQPANTNASFPHANAGPEPSAAATTTTTTTKSSTVKKGRDSAGTGAATSSRTENSLPQVFSDEAQSQSSGLTPASRLQISDSELLHQIRYVKRPPEYMMALNAGDFGTNTVIGTNEAYGPPFSPSADSTQDNVGEGKKPEIVIIDNDTTLESIIADEEDKQPQQRPDDEDGVGLATTAETPTTEQSPPSPSQSHTSSTQHPVPSVVSSATERPKQKPKRRKKIMENEIIIMTDRDVQVWDLGVWGKARRVRGEFVRPPDS